MPGRTEISFALLSAPDRDGMDWPDPLQPAPVATACSHPGRQIKSAALRRSKFLKLVRLSDRVFNGLPYAMVSKHKHWQALWQIDQREGVAAHDTGLLVRLRNGRGEAENAGEMVELLALQHGSHNAQAMVQRLVREGAQLLVDPHSKGWRSAP